MTDWKQKIEAQIADCRGYAENEYDALHDYADIMQALLDVAVAAEAWSCVEPIAARQVESDLHDALDKLREVGDD